MADAGEVRELARSVAEAAERLQAAEPERRARWLARAFEQLAEPEGELGRACCRLLAERSGLSEPMVAWALETTLAPLTHEALVALEAAPAAPGSALRARPGRLCAVVLAGNVTTTAARAVGIPLLFGWPVLCKGASDDDTLARLLEAALAESDPELGPAYRVVTFAAEDAACRDALLEQADAVSVYGGDHTLRTLRAQVPAGASFIGHGHGLGAALVARPALSDVDEARRAARGLALDVAAYDQRGCLSPHVVWVERGGRIPPLRFAELLHEELAVVGQSLPRGRLPMSSASAQLAWRGVGAMRGALLEGDGFGVSYEEDGPLRVSPGYRNVQVIALEELDALPARLAPLGVHLKCLGVAGVAQPERLARGLPERVAPRICALGSMQRPGPHALQDGLPAWEGLVRWVDAP